VSDVTFYDCLEATKREIVNLNLPLIAPSSVIVHKALTDHEETIFPAMPGVIVAPIGPEIMDVPGSTNQTNAIAYPVGVAFFANDGESRNEGRHGLNDQTHEFRERMRWRGNVIKRFHMQRLPGVDNVQTCLARPNTVLDVAQWRKRGIWISAITLEFHARENRITN